MDYLLIPELVHVSLDIVRGDQRAVPHDTAHVGKQFLEQDKQAY